LSCVAGEEEHADEKEHNHGPNDPHFWLDPVQAQTQIEVLRDALIMIDQSGQEIYTNNAGAYAQKLASLHDAYQKGLASCKIRTIIVPHNAFQYLGKRSNINMISIAGISPDEEPPPKRIAELADIAKARGIKYIFFETLANPKLAKTIATEAAIETLILNPIEGLTPDEVKAGKTYLSVMEENLEQLRKAMECE
jgi:zinc transport system substrate-binding protein